MTISYGSVCSGIEAASVAWKSLGFHAEWFSEIEGFPSAVLAHRWPEVPNLGDMTKLARQVLTGAIKAPELMVGGTPCQAFSVEGGNNFHMNRHLKLLLPGPMPGQTNLPHSMPLRHYGTKKPGTAGLRRDHTR